MDLRTESPFWLMKSGIVRSYPSVKQSCVTDVAIMGGGITGSLIAYHLACEGIPAIVLDKRKIGMGSTCASTALLQYEIDTHLSKLATYVGKKKASASFLMCADAIDEIQTICHSLHADVGFTSRKSFYYASSKKDVAELDTEYKLRKEIGIELDFLTQNDINQLFPFSAPAALLSEKGAEIDAYLFTHQLLKVAAEKSVDIYDNTEVTAINTNKRGVELQTNYGTTIKAKKLIIACGYESQSFIKKKIVDFNSSFAIISEPFDTPELWYQNCLIWETARPYLYMRTTSDGRVLVGGKDEPFYNPAKRDRLASRKALLLKKAFNSKFPSLEFRTDFLWAGTFAETVDGLPYIGRIPEFPNTIFALGFGGNGIVFSQIAAEMIRDNLMGRKHRGDAIFGFNR